MSNPSFFNTILLWPIINILVAIYKLLLFVHIPYALGFSIILLTVLIRLLLYPLTTSQLRASAKMQKLSPHLSSLREKHKGDTARLQQETMRLYKEHGVNPAAGCLPMLLQLPIIWALYSVLNQVVRLKASSVVSEINKIVYSDSLKLSSAWNLDFFGLALGKSPSEMIASLGPLILLIPLTTALFQLLQSKMLFSKPQKEAAKQAKTKEAKEKPKDNFSSMFQMQTLYFFPVMIGFFSFTLPLGLSLYWNTFTLFGILQQYFVMGWGGLSDWMAKVTPRKAHEKEK